MRRWIPIALALALPAATISLHAQLAITIDLAAQSPGVDVQRQLAVDRRTPVSITLVNVVPDARYVVSVDVDDVPVGALVASKQPALALPTGPAVHLLYTRLLAELDTAGDERAVGRSARQTLRDVASAYGDTGGFLCDSVDARTVHRLVDVASLAPGQRLRVSIARHSVEGSEEARWTTTYATEPPGEWRISLGFAFPIIAGAFEQYSIRRDTAGVARVASRPGDDRIRAVPALFFNWTARDELLSAWSFSLGGGLGFDFQNPVVLLGGALSFHQNITVVAGAAAHRAPRLASEYTMGDVVDDRTISDDLTTLGYHIDPFVGVSFRLLGATFGR